MNIASLLDAAAAEHPEKPAVSRGTASVLSYRELARRAAAVASWLGEHSEPGGTVAVASENCVEYLELLFAAWYAGRAVAPMNARLSAGELAYMAQDCEAEVVFASADLAEQLRPLLPGVKVIVPGLAPYDELIACRGDAPPECPAEQIAWIFYTSGTTGKPKGAMITHGNLAAMTDAYFSDVDDLGSEDALLHLAPTSHASGLFALAFIAAGANNILPAAGGFDADELVALSEHYRSLSFFLPPPVLRQIGDYGLQDRINADHIRSVLLGAAPISPTDLRNAAQVFGPRLWNGYGQGESPCTITAMSKTMIRDALESGDEEKLASVGVSRSGIELRIADDDGAAVDTGTPGEVLVRGATVMAGYFHQPEATSATLVDGWLHTGDVGVLDQDGYLTLIDRKKDVIISGGMNIYAREVENVLSCCEGVRDVAVIGIPDPRWGEAVTAVIVCKAGEEPDPQDLDALCLDNMARFKRPKHYRFVDDLPRNASGKVLKRELRTRFADASQAR